MNHRRRKAMRFEKLLWITKEPRRALVFYLINTPLPKSGFLACISSRITTGIHVVRYYQINDNWFNEPFAVSQYRLLILRHAWLNLWDKHMTTGRINQVTIPTRLYSYKYNQLVTFNPFRSISLIRAFVTFKEAFTPRNNHRHFNYFLVKLVLKIDMYQQWTSLSPGLTIFDQDLLVQRTKITDLSEDYCKPTVK